MVGRRACGRGVSYSVRAPPFARRQAQSGTPFSYLRTYPARQRSKQFLAGRTVVSSGGNSGSLAGSDALGRARRLLAGAFSAFFETAAAGAARITEGPDKWLSQPEQDQATRPATSACGW